MKALGLDVGTKTIGLAIGVIERKLARPLTTLARKSVRKDTDEMVVICKKHQITHLVVGLPIELSGEEGRSARLARQVGDMLAEKTGLPLTYHDEGFTTVEAETRLQTLGKTERERKEMIDQIAAVVILEDWWFEQ